LKKGDQGGFIMLKKLDRQLALTYAIWYVLAMGSLTASKARQGFYRLLDEVAENHEPVLITGKRHNAVLISEEDFRAIEETLYLANIKGMVESIKEGMKTPASEMDKDLDW
jgi:antitoxin YefM